MSNQITVIHPYKVRGVWVFDDPEVDLVKEPFVCGIPEMIEVLTEGIEDAEDGFNMFFSADPFRCQCF